MLRLFVFEVSKTISAFALISIGEYGIPESVSMFVEGSSAFPKQLVECVLIVSNGPSSSVPRICVALRRPPRRPLAAISSIHRLTHNNSHNISNRSSNCITSNNSQKQQQKSSSWIFSFRLNSSNKKRKCIAECPSRDANELVVKAEAGWNTQAKKQQALLNTKR